MSHAPATSRNPTNDGISQIAVINRILTGSGENFRDQLYNILATHTEYGPFSNTGFPVELRNGWLNSLEGIHDTIHALVSGHMGQVPFSAFDPLFFLHHANIDRLFAVWSAINPNSYVLPQTNEEGTFAIPAGSTEDTNTPLKPFRKDAAGSFHASTTARLTSTFGYTYPEVVDWNVIPTQLAANVRSIVNALYHPTDGLSKRTVNRIMRRAETQTREWLINFSVRWNVDTAVAVHFFLGEPPAEPENWSSASNLIVSQMILPAMLHSNMDAPTAMAQIPLSRSLIDAQKGGKLNNDEVGSIITFLKRNLQWRVQTVAGQVLGERKLTELKISIIDWEIVHTSNKADQFHRYGKINEHAELQWGNF
jgi:tyrosinase